MKKILSLLILAISASGIHADAEAIISFEEMTHDFGTIDENGGAVCHEFEFTNTGDTPLVILKATAACGCTRPEFPKNPIKAGQKAKIKVTYLPKGRPGEFAKTVTIKTNATQKNLRIKIEGFVTPAGK